MADWAKTNIDEVRSGNVVEIDGVIGQVLSSRVVKTLGPNLGHIELYLKEHGPKTAPPGTTIDVFR